MTKREKIDSNKICFNKIKKFILQEEKRLENQIYDEASRLRNETINLSGVVGKVLINIDRLLNKKKDMLSDEEKLEGLKEVR